MGTVSPARAQTQTACSGDKRSNHKAITIGLCLCRCVRKQGAPILVNAGVEVNMKQQQQPSWYVIISTEKINFK